jgi:hypothetical protein
VANLAFPALWVAPGMPGVRDCDGTYCETPLESLPPVEASDDLDWLKPLHPMIDAAMKPYRPCAQDRERCARNARMILAQAKALAIELPKAFAELILSETLQDRFPSPTACYFDLPEKIVPAPFGLDGHVVRFLNDSQGCVIWYLHLPAHGAARVLAYSPVVYANQNGDEDVVYFLEDLEGHDPSVIANAEAATRIVSRTLPEFLFRYWLESSIWFKRSRGIELSAKESEYIGTA